MMPLGYNIFRSNDDEQREAMVTQQQYASEGITWHIRMLKIRYYMFTTLWAIGIACLVALLDYSIFLFTDHKGILGWLISAFLG